MIKYLVALFPVFGIAQSYAPPAGQTGSTAIYMDSSIIQGWADGITLNRGYLDIATPASGYASFGEANAGLFKAEGNATDVVSLGDAGEAVLTFPSKIKNGVGPDFAVFENSLWDDFLEFAFVEVSSDGVNFVRFPAISEIQTSIQVGGFGSTDCRFVHNLAGKYRSGYGTPFDLEDLVDSVGIDLNAISHVKLIDVVGSLDPAYGSLDANGNSINNNYPTAFESCGFDLDAVGVIHFADLGMDELENNIRIYPNPTVDWCIIELDIPAEIQLINLAGQELLRVENETNFRLDVRPFGESIYILKVITKTGILTKRIVLIN